MNKNVGNLIRSLPYGQRKPVELVCGTANHMQMRTYLCRMLRHQGYQLTPSNKCPSFRQDWILFAQPLSMQSVILRKSSGCFCFLSYSFMHFQWMCLLCYAKLQICYRQVFLPHFRISSEQCEVVNAQKLSILTYLPAFFIASFVQFGNSLDRRTVKQASHSQQ